MEPNNPIFQPVDPTTFRRLEEKRKPKVYVITKVPCPTQHLGKFLSSSLPEKLSALIPAVTCIFVGCVAFSNFRKAIPYQIPLTLAQLAIITKLPRKITEQDKEFLIKYHTTKLAINIGCILAPILEEIAFRGILQSVFRKGVQITLLSLTAIEPTKILLVAQVVSLVGSSIAFGYVHKSNEHSGAKLQAVLATLDGVVYGSFFEMYGLSSSIAMHMVNNTFCYALQLVFLHRNPRLIKVKETNDN